MKIDVFNPSSIQNAIDFLGNEYVNNIEKKMSRLCEELAEIGSIVAQNEYGDTVIVSYEKVDTSLFKIHAKGETVCFLEFGAGVRTDSSHKYATKMPFEVEPGSWSEYHARTYQIWIENGKQGEYQYNIIPKKGMLRAEEYIQYFIKDIAIAIFGE